jgi:hypothetical protein
MLPSCSSETHKKGNVQYAFAAHSSALPLFLFSLTASISSTKIKVIHANSVQYLPEKLIQKPKFSVYPVKRTEKFALKILFFLTWENE